MKSWKRIPFTDLPFEVSIFGEIRNIETKRPIKTYKRNTGYTAFRTKVAGKLKTVYVHRCVLSAYNPIDGYEKLYVHHLDNNPANNKIGNLKWCTQKENVMYAVRDGLWENNRRVAIEVGKKRYARDDHPFKIETKEQKRKRYAKRSENYKENGNHPNKGRFGLKGTNVKLTKELIVEIKERAKTEYHIAIAKSLNLSRSTIDNVVHDRKKYL